MTRDIIHSDSAPAAIGPYSQAVRTGAGALLFCSGQIALDPATGEIVGPEDVRLQTEQVMKNLQAVLEAGGMSFDDVVKTTIFLTDLQDFVLVNEVYGRHFSDAPPARATVQVAALPKGVAVEIECIAAR